jgi:hypothetical protein
MKLTHVDEVIAACNNHLDTTKARGTQIESYLTRYLLVTTCAAFEEEVKRIVLKRAARTGDRYLLAFVESCIGAVFRSPKTSDISGLLNRLGEDFKKDFQEKLKGNSRAETYFNNIVINRHGTAHRTIGSSLTLKELIGFYEEGHTVLDCLHEVISKRRRVRHKPSA